MTTENPVSPKAIASTAAAGVGTAVSTLTIWVLGVTAWGASSSAAEAQQAIAAVPGPVSAVIVLVIPAALAALAGYRVNDPHRVTTSQLARLRELADFGRDDEAPKKV